MKLPITDIALAEYQKRAVNWWRDHGYKGLIAFPIGLAGTVTGLTAISEIDQPSVTVVLCTDVESLETFTEYFEEGEDTDVHSISPTTESESPLTSLLAGEYNNERPYTVVVLTTNILEQNVATEAVNAAVDRPLQVYLPELDSLPSARLCQLNDLNFDRILGMSIVPEERLERVYSVDPERIDAYQAVFEGNIHSYSLENAIEQQFLRPFRYYPIIIRSDLNNTEAVEDESLQDYGEGDLKALKRELALPEQISEQIGVLENLLNSELRSPAVFFCKHVRTVESVCGLLDQYDCQYRSATAADADVGQKIQEFVDGDCEYLVVSMAAVKFHELGQVESAVILSSSQQPISEYQSLNQVFMGTEWRNATREAVDIYDLVPLPHQKTRTSDDDIERFLRRSTGVMKILIDAAENQHRTEYRLYRQLEEFDFGHLVYD